MKTAAKKLLIRADAIPKIGSGHVMRGLSFAQTWLEQGGEVICLTNCSPEISARLKSENIDVRQITIPIGSLEDAEYTGELAKANQIDWIFLDGYHFVSEYQRCLKTYTKLLYLDDNVIFKHYYADLILNQNLFAEESLYSNREEYTGILTGIRFLLLRKEFYKWLDWEREIRDEVTKVLVSFGSSDNKNLTTKVIRSLDLITDHELTLTVVVGDTNSHISEVQDSIEKSHHKIELLQGVRDISRLMAKADIAVSAAGTTSWELAFMGLPAINIICADNQKKIAEVLDVIGISCNLGYFEKVTERGIADAVLALCHDRNKRQSMSHYGRELIDIYGSERVIDRMGLYDGSIDNKDDFKIREAVFSDIVSIWRLANNPQVRKNSFNPDPISFVNHVNWYKSKIDSGDTVIWVIEYNGVVSGQLRYDKIESGLAEMDINVAENCRGKGIGKRILTGTMHKTCEILGVTGLKSILFTENILSNRLFQKAGFEEVKEMEIQNRAVNVYKWKYTKPK